MNKKTSDRFFNGSRQRRSLLNSPIKIFIVDKKKKKGLFHGEINHCIGNQGGKRFDCLMNKFFFFLSRKAKLVICVNDWVLLFVIMNREKTLPLTIRSHYSDVLISDNIMFNLWEMKTTEICRENHYLLLISSTIMLFIISEVEQYFFQDEFDCSWRKFSQLSPPPRSLECFSSIVFQAKHRSLMQWFALLFLIPLIWNQRYNYHCWVWERKREREKKTRERERDVILWTFIPFF